ncbi:MAG: 4Fe-4S binding protein [Deltaproteobacteria bacterium]|nr:MAG: 4Fe-4S binding protein [Deltaproteobacteria bacterium]
MTLYEGLAARVGLANSQIAPRLFQMLADETDAEILLSLPAQVSDLEDKLQLSPEEIEQKIQELFLKGLVFPSRKTSPPTYRMCRDMVQFHDATILWKDAPQEFLNLWQEFMEVEWPKFARNISEMLPKPYTRVIPVNVSVEAKTHILDFESVSEVVRQAKVLAVTKCTCRLTARKCDRPLEVCIQVNNAAAYALARGTGRKIDVQEALDILRMAEEEGLIHVTMNRHQVDHFICNCCPCCCQTMPILIKGGIRVVDPSRFRAEIDSELCSGCGTCHERCYFGAISWKDGEGSINLVEASACMGCGLCQVTCPEDAINLVEARAEDFVP